MAEFKLDDRRRERLGFDEAIFCQNKSVAQLAAILEHARERGEPLLLTRLQPGQFAALPESLREPLDYDERSGTAYAGVFSVPADDRPRLAVVSAGTSDIGVCREAVRTLRYYGIACEEIYDVGVAGLWRLLERVDDLRRYPLIIAVAGMDAALPSVLGGLLPGVVIAVPTSTGYGTADGGRTALNAILASCAPGLLTVNIDNGYGAACAALRMLRHKPCSDINNDNHQP